MSRHPPPWRTGRRVRRTVYDANDELIGLMDTPGLAAQVVEACNGCHRAWDALVEVSALLNADNVDRAREVVRRALHGEPI